MTKNKAQIILETVWKIPPPLFLLLGFYFVWAGLINWSNEILIVNKVFSYIGWTLVLGGIIVVAIHITSRK